MGWQARLKLVACQFIRIHSSLLSQCQPIFLIFYFQVPTNHNFTRYLFTATHYLFLFQINFVFTLSIFISFFPISYRSISLSLSLSQYHTIHTGLTLLASVHYNFFLHLKRFPVHESVSPTALLTANRYFVVTGVIKRRQRETEV